MTPQTDDEIYQKWCTVKSYLLWDVVRDARKSEREIRNNEFADWLDHLKDDSDFKLSPRLLEHIFNYMKELRAGDQQ